MQPCGSRMTRRLAHSRASVGGRGRGSRRVEQSGQSAGWHVYSCLALVANRVVLGCSDSETPSASLLPLDLYNTRCCPAISAVLCSIRDADLFHKTQQSIYPGHFHLSWLALPLKPCLNPQPLSPLLCCDQLGSHLHRLALLHHNTKCQSKFDNTPCINP